MGSGSPSPTRRMRWEGSKGTVGAGEVHGGPRVVGGGPRFWGAFGFLRLAIVGIPHSSTRVKRFGRDKSNSSPLLHSPQHKYLVAALPLTEKYLAEMTWLDNVN